MLGEIVFASVANISWIFQCTEISASLFSGFFMNAASNNNPLTFHSKRGMDINS
jgi:hypothetical protein